MYYGEICTAQRRSGREGEDGSCYEVLHFERLFEKFANVAEHEIVYTTVKSAPLKDGQVGRARMGSVIRF